MYRLMAIVCLVLSACTPKITSDGGAYRAATAPIYSNAVFDFAQIDGHWDQVAGFSEPTVLSCLPGGATFSPKGGVLWATYSLCLSGQTVMGEGIVSPSGPGRFGISGRSDNQDWWVLWVDEGYRTMAIGTPSGEFGFVLNRGKTLPADRLMAAREVLDFNGYDTKKLVSYGG